MKRLPVLLILSCLMAGLLWLGIPASLGQPAHPAASDSLHLKTVTDTITDLERSWVAAIVQKDTATLDRLLALEFNGTSPNGMTYTKQMAIADIKSGVYVVDRMDLDEISVNAYGNTAVAFTTQREKSKSGVEDFSGHYTYTDVWVKKNGRWQVVASHGSRFDD
jgi:ketosteroid isomerase-like protein